MEGGHQRRSSRYGALERMQSGGKPNRMQMKLILTPDDPMKSALEMAKRNLKCESTGLRTLHHHQQQFWYLKGGCYRSLTDDEVRNEIWAFLYGASNDQNAEAFKPEQRDVSNVLSALKAVCEIPSEVSPPAWLPGVPDALAKVPPSQILAVANGLLHVSTGTLYPATPAYFGMSISDVEFDPAAGHPYQWHKFLEDVFGEDHEGRDTLQEWFGYCLTPDTSLQKALLMLGPPRSGKGTIGKITRALLGDASVASLTVANLWETFGLQSLIGIPLAIMPDARFSKRADPATVAERLLSISGQDAVSINRKFLGAWMGQLPTRFMILTNELPYMKDSSGALVERFIVLKLTISFLGREDPMLFERLRGELSGILNWAVEGYRRLRLRGRFQQPELSADTIRAMKEISSTVGVFIEEHCLLGKNLSVAKQKLYDAWVLWCAENGHKPGSQQGFGRELRAAFPDVGDSRPRGGQRQRLYTGIGLAPDALRVVEGGRARGPDRAKSVGGPHGPNGPHT